MKFNWMKVLKPVLELGSVVTANPIITGVLAALKAVQAIKTDSDEERAQLYTQFAKGFMRISAEISECLKDGKITEAEEREIIREFEQAFKDLNQ